MALGGFLGGLANLGAVTRGYEAQQAQEQQLQLAALRQKITQDALAEEQRQRQLQQQSASAAFGLLNDPNSPLAGLANIGGGQPNYAPGAVQSYPLGSPGGPTAQPLPSAPQFGGMPSPTMGSGQGLAYTGLPGGALRSGLPRITGPGGLIETTESGGRNINNARFDPTHTAGGIAQITDSTWNDFAPQMGLPRLQYPQSPKDVNVADQRRVEQAIYDQRGVAPWASYNPQLRQALSQLDGAQQQEAQGAAISTATAVPPAYSGRLNLPQLAQLIKRNNPGISDEAGMGALVMLHNLMSPDAKAELEAYKFGVEEADKAAQRKETAARDVERERHDRAMEEKQAGGTPPRFGTIDDLMERWREDYKRTHNGQEPSWQDAAKQRAELSKEAKPMSATQAGIVRRLEFGTGEVAKALTSITQLPYGTTLGMFGGAQGAMGKQLLDNVRKSLANAVTPESAQVLRALTGGLGRGLGIIASGGVAQGLQNFSEQMGQLVPTSNDTGLTIATKFADMRQLFDVATDVMLADDQIPDAQKELMRKLRDQVHKAVPFETIDVAKVAGDPDDEHLQDFAAKMGLGKSNAWVKRGDQIVGPNGETQPLPPAFKLDPDGTKYEK